MNEASVVEEHLGRGPSFPLRPDPVGGTLCLRAGAEKVRQSVELVLRTEPGERVMRPAFGCPLRQFLMEPNTVATRSRLERAVHDALTAYEPRVAVEQVLATPGEDPALIHLSIRYRHVLDDSRATLALPFRLEV